MSDVIQFRPRPALAPSDEAARHARLAMAADALLRAESLAYQAAQLLVSAQTKSMTYRAADQLRATRQAALNELMPPPKGAA